MLESIVSQSTSASPQDMKNIGFFLANNSSSITSHSYLYYVLKLPLINWMVQRTSLMKP